MKGVARESLGFAGDVLQRMRDIWKTYLLAVLGTVGAILLGLCIAYVARALVGPGSQAVEAIIPSPDALLALLVALLALISTYRTRRKLKSMTNRLEELRKTIEKRDRTGRFG
jgi:ABC-type sulfate transport system permease component